MSINLTDAIKNIKSLDNLKTLIESYGVTFKTSGGYTSAICPFHKENTSSFHIREKNGEANFKCFGCEERGDIINFIKKIENLSTLEATKKAYEILGLDCNIEPSKVDELIDYINNSKEYNINDFSIENVFVYMLNEEHPAFLKIKYRSLKDETQKTLRTYKVVDNGKQFMLTTKQKGGEYEQTIYNYPKVKKAIEKDNNIYFVEGEKDAETLMRYGLTATTIYSKKWDDKYTEQLKGSKVVFIGDTGEAGEEFKKIVYENLKDVVKTFKVVNLPNIEDLGNNADVSDWLDIEGNTKEKLIDVIKKSEYKALKSYGDYHFNGMKTYLSKFIETDNGTVEQQTDVYDGLIEIESINIDIDENKESLVISSMMYDRIAKTNITKGELFSKKSYTETLNNVRGFLIEPKVSTIVQDLLITQYKLKDRKNELNEIIVTNQIGWINNKYINTFVYPRYDMSIDNNVFYKENGNYNKTFRHKGTFDEFTKKILLPMLNKDIGVITISTAIASILLELLEVHESFILDIYGKNGKGKTILLSVIASMFGKPRDYMLEWEATKNGIISNATALNNFPLFLDDTKKCEDKDKIVEVIYSLSGGKEKARANQDGTAKEQKTFKNITISTGETSLLNYIKGESSGAGAYGRVLSIDTDEYTIFKSKEEADTIDTLSKKHYGIFGYEFCKWLYEASKDEDTLDNWIELYMDYKDYNYNQVEHHTSTRKANHIAILQIAHMILQLFLKYKGIHIDLNFKVFDKFLIESDEFSKEHDVYKASFDAVIEYCLVNANRLYSANIFTSGDEYSVPNNCIGWVKDDVYIITKKEVLESILNEHGDSKDILKEWRERGYIKTEPGRFVNKVQTPYFVDGKKPYLRAYQLNGKFYNNIDDTN